MGLSISDFLGSSSNSNSSSGIFGSSSILGDYAMIKNGSYKKLMKAYYSNESSSSVSSDDAKKETSALTKLNTDAKELKDAASKLLSTGEKSVFNKVTKTDEDGNTTTGYDTDAIYKAVKGFVDSYNSVVEQADKVSDDKSKDRVVSMIKNTGLNANLLDKIGITIGDDYKLTIDEEKFKAADMNTAKTLFNGAGSFASNVSNQSSFLMRQAMEAANKNSNYTSSGTVDASSLIGSMFNTEG